ncbi:hypothetical protein MSAN_00860700 [Mycena sanguinolenta]|uniref:Uncharacterized protein n=1 Tax=Mycena sanguinolenta TaxID=230812 RepID=A0A8H6Z269_9AGAR|nr:hypothetical protein MSAN_00860700 [Mycena sanguinolenta]
MQEICIAGGTQTQVSLASLDLPQACAEAHGEPCHYVEATARINAHDLPTQLDDLDLCLCPHSISLSTSPAPQAFFTAASAEDTTLRRTSADTATTRGARPTTIPSARHPADAASRAKSTTALSISRYYCCRNLKANALMRPGRGSWLLRWWN